MKRLLLYVFLFCIAISANCQTSLRSEPEQKSTEKNKFIGIWIPYKSTFCRISAYTEEQRKQLMKSIIQFNSTKATFFNEVISSPKYKTIKESKEVALSNCDFDDTGISIINDSVNCLTIHSGSSLNYLFIINGDELIINWDGLIIFLRKKEN